MTTTNGVAQLGRNHPMIDVVRTPTVSLQMSHIDQLWAMGAGPGFHFLFGSEFGDPPEGLDAQ